MGSIAQGASLGAGAAIGSTMINGAINSMTTSKPENNTNQTCQKIMEQFYECSKINMDLNVCKPLLEEYTHCLSFR